MWYIHLWMLKKSEGNNVQQWMYHIFCKKLEEGDVSPVITAEWYRECIENTKRAAKYVIFNIVLKYNIKNHFLTHYLIM